MDFSESLSGHGTDAAPTVARWCGGLPALTRMTELFYQRYVPQDPVLSEVFAGMSPDHPERVAMWLTEVLGGPPHYSDAYGGYPRMLAAHLGRQLTEDARARWVTLMARAATESGLPHDAEFRSALVSYLEWGSHLAVENSQPGAHPPLTMPMPHWDWGTAGPPGNRVSALAPTDVDPEPELPGPLEPVAFERHVKPLFRQRDRQSMRSAFDLWSHADVSTHAAAILDRLRDGSMPCDGAWAAEKIDVFARWVASGKTP